MPRQGSPKQPVPLIDLDARGRQSRATGQEQEQRQEPTISLKVAHWNAEGIKNKKPELQEFLRKNDIDVICVQETHLNKPQKFFIRGYQDDLRVDRDGHKGGIITLVKNSIPAVEIARSNGDLEYLTIKLILPSGDLFITNCYSPSSTNLVLDAINIKPSRHLVAGDLNSHSPSWGYEEADARGNILEDWMIDNNLILINLPDDDPTCYSRSWKSSSTPDVAAATDDVQKVCS